jgi:hypothetical protein
MLTYGGRRQEVEVQRGEVNGGAKEIGEVHDNLYNKQSRERVYCQIDRQRS